MPAAAAVSDTDSSRRLSVVRHAKSSWHEAGQADFERPLNARGERDAPEMGRRMWAWPNRPTQVLTSAARRAVQTTQAMVAAWSPPPEIVFEQRLYLASASALLDLVRDLDPAHRHIMLVGHNPGLSEFVDRFGDASINGLPTCAVVRLKLWVPEWSDAGWGCASAEQIDTPKSTPA